LKKIFFTIFFLCLSHTLFGQISPESSVNISPRISDIERSRFQKSNFRALNNYSDYKSDTTINVNYYKLELVAQTSPNLLTGKVTINSLVKTPSLNSLFYDLTDVLEVDSVALNSSPAGLVSFTHITNKIFIKFPRDFSFNELISVTVYYRGVPDPTGYGSFIFSTHGNIPVIWSLSEPFGASDWFPCKNVPDDKADSSDVNITCSENFTAVSNGILREAANNGNGTKTYKWHNSYPIANYLISIAVTNYAQYNSFFRYSAADSMPVNHFIYPENLERLKPLLDKTNGMLSYYSNIFGMYPFVKEKYGHAEFGELGGMEHQTVSSMGYWSEGIIAHELTHQWFGDKITCKDWRHIWLNEGFATYGEALHYEQSAGQIVYDGYMLATMMLAKTAVGSIYVQNDESVAEIFSASRSYAKGGTVLHMLRGMLSDSLFFAAIKKYINDPALVYKNAVTADFQRNAQEVTGQNLNYFFNQWIYGENYPKYTVSMNAANSGNGFFNAAVNITQRVNTNPAFFTMPVEIKFFFGDSDTTVMVFNNAQVQSFNIQLRKSPVGFKVDPSRKILCDITGDETPVPVSYSLSQNYPNPFNPATTISYQIFKSSDVQLKIYNSIGQEIRNYSYLNQRDGTYKITFDGIGLSSGIYFYKLIATDTKSGDVIFSDSKSMMLVK